MCFDLFRFLFKTLVLESYYPLLFFFRVVPSLISHLCRHEINKNKRTTRKMKKKEKKKQGGKKKRSRQIGGATHDSFSNVTLVCLFVFSFIHIFQWLSPSHKTRKNNATTKNKLC